MSENTPNVEVNAAFNEAQPDAAADLGHQNDVKDAMSEKLAAEGNVDKSEDNQFASKFAALSRKEKELRQRQMEVESKYSEYEAWKAEQETKQNQKEPEIPLEYRLKKDPLTTLSELGLSYDKLTELALNDGKLTPDMQMELMKREMEEQYNSKFNSLKEELESYRQSQEEAKYEETVNSFKQELTSFVNQGESYDLIRATDAVDLVYEEIENHFQSTGEILDMEKAAEVIESQLREEYETILSKNAEKFGYTKAQQEEAKEKLFTSSPTLSNSQTSTVSTNGERFLSDDESKQAAANLIKWND